MSNEMVLSIKPDLTFEVVMSDDVVEPGPIIIPHLTIRKLLDREPTRHHFISTARLSDKLFRSKDGHSPITDPRMVIEDPAERLVQLDLDTDLFGALSNSRFLG